MEDALVRNLSDVFTREKTFSFFFPTENERLTKDSSLTANDLETSEIPYSSHFALNQKTLFLNAKVIIFFER